MKLILRYVLIIIGIVILYKINAGSLLKDTKSIFTVSPKDILTTSTYADTVPSDYLQILHLQKGCCKYTPTSKFYLEHTAISNIRNPVSDFVYNRHYYLQIYSLSKSFSLPVGNTITESYVNSTNFGQSLADIGSAVEYNFPIVLPKKFTIIKLKLLGKNNKIILKNDSIAYYYSLFQKFAMQYDQNDTNEIYGEAKGSFLFYTNRLPLEIIFLKRNKNLYLLTMSIYLDDQNTSYKPGMLYNIINNK